MKNLETERLIVRHLRANDVDEMYHICSDAELMRFVGDGQPLKREQKTPSCNKKNAARA